MRRKKVVFFPEDIDDEVLKILPPWIQIMNFAEK